MNDKELLTPLQAAEAMLKDRDIEFLSDFGGKWTQVRRPYSGQCLARLSRYKIRLKPNKININGVLVPAPLSIIPLSGNIYYPNIVKRKVSSAYAINAKNQELYWLTREDAQEVLDAMLIPFNDLEKRCK